MTARCSEIAQVSGKCVAQVEVAAIRRITQKVGPLLRENLCSKPFPYSYRKFIHRRNTRDERDARASACCPKIKLFSYALVRNCFHPIRNAKGRLSRWMGFGSATADSSRGEFVCAQKGVRERVCCKCPRFGF